MDGKRSDSQSGLIARRVRVMNEILLAATMARMSANVYRGANSADYG